MPHAHPALDAAAAQRHTPLTQREWALFTGTCLVGVLMVAAMPVFAQEAYYWTYAQHPGLSYFDHPPMVAWLIWLGTQVFGDGVFGLRLGTWLCSVGSAWLGIELLRGFGARSSGIAAWLVLTASVPILVATKFLSNPDSPLVFFWTLCLWALLKVRIGRPAWWLLAGAAAGCALLSKYTAVFLAIGGVLVMLFDPLMRHQLRRPWPWLGMLTAAIVFLPVLIWNLQNNFASFRFQTANRVSNAQFGFRWLVQLVGGQFGVLNPPLVVASTSAVAWLLRRWKRDPAVLWVLAFGVPLPLFLLCNSLFVHVKINWLIPAYVPLLLGCCLWWQDRGQALAVWRRRLLAVGVCGGVTVAACAWVIRFVPQSTGTTWAGWQEIAERTEHWEEQLVREHSATGNVFTFAGDYRDAAQLGRALTIRTADQGHTGPHVESVMAQNVLGEPALMFDYWFEPAEHVGQNAIFVLPRPEDRPELLASVRSHFKSIERVESMQIERLGNCVMNADIYVCRDYLGPK
ncbi:MAG: glycosyltransferase family 39 protein [Planctomycetota bacterium]